MATVYHRDQPGAPTLVYNTSPTSIAHFTAFKTILKSCLVTGFGSQPAAGWELVSEGSDYLVLRPASHSGYVCFSWVNTSNIGLVNVYLAATYLGMNGNVIAGEGVTSGRTPGSVHRFSLAGFVNYSAGTTWMAIADGSTCIFNSASGSTAPSGMESTTVTTAGPLLYFGDDSEGNLIVVGGQENTALSGQSLFSASGFTSLRDPTTGLLVDNKGLAVSTPGLGDRGASFSAYMVLPLVDLSRVIWLAGAPWGFGGVMKGIVIPGVLSQHFLDPAARALGFPGTPNTRNINTPLDLGGGHTYFLAYKYTNGTTLLFTDNPEFW